MMYPMIKNDICTDQETINYNSIRLAPKSIPQYPTPKVHHSVKTKESEREMRLSFVLSWKGGP